LLAELGEYTVPFTAVVDRVWVRQPFSAVYISKGLEATPKSLEEKTKVWPIRLSFMISEQAL